MDFLSVGGHLQATLLCIYGSFDDLSTELPILVHKLPHCMASYGMVCHQSYPIEPLSAVLTKQVSLRCNESYVRFRCRTDCLIPTKPLSENKLFGMLVCNA